MTVVPLLASLVTVLASVPASAEVIPPGSPYWGKLFSLTPNESEQPNCMDDGDLLIGEGIYLITACQSVNSQQFSYDISDHEIYSGLFDGSQCMTIQPGYTGAGSPIVDEPCDNGANWNQWRIINQTLQSSEATTYNGKPMCLDDTANGGVDTLIELWPCNGGGNQNWDLVGYHS